MASASNSSAARYLTGVGAVPVRAEADVKEDKAADVDEAVLELELSQSRLRTRTLQSAVADWELLSRNAAAARSRG